MATKLSPQGIWQDDDDDGPYIDQYGDEWDCSDGYDFWNFEDDNDQNYTDWIDGTL